MRFIKFLLLVLSILSFFWLAYWATDNFVEPKVYNYMIKTFTATKPGSDNITLIVIDDKSIGRHRWPWKRTLYCPIFNYFKEYTKSKIIIFDSILTSYDNPETDNKYFNTIKNIDNIIVGTNFYKRDYLNKHQGELYDKKFMNKFPGRINDLRLHANDNYLNSMVVFPQKYFDSVKNVGSIKAATGDDGYMRVAVMAVNYKGEIYPSISLKAYSYLNNNEWMTLTDREILTNETKVRIPLNRENTGIYSLIRFYKPNKQNSGYTHKTYSAIDIIDSYNELKQGKTPIINPKDFDDKIIFIGANVKATATGLSDVKRTPVAIDHSGLDVQATVLDNILNKYFMYELHDIQNIIISILLIAATFLLIRSFSLFIALFSITIMIVIYILFAALLYSKGFAISTITPVAMSFITMIFAYSHKYIIEDRNKEKIKTAMGKYISEDIMKNVVKNIDELKLGGKKAEVTVLFADIRGFTSLSEKLSADEVSVILNEYFTEIEPIVTANNGVINKFIGDAVMAIFGEPIQDENHPQNAVKCAYMMLQKVDKLQQKWLSEGKPKIEIGIGINTGEVFVGNIGSEKRMEYTVIGDTVNLASRIESNNKVYKTNLLISSSTYNFVRNIVDVVKISDVKIRGKEKVLDLYEVIRLIG